MSHYRRRATRHGGFAAWVGALVALLLAVMALPAPAHAATAIQTKYQQLGGVESILGGPAGGEVCGLSAGGCYQVFQNGVIVWSPASGAHVSIGAIREEYKTTGFERGKLGYPLTDELCGIKYQGCYQVYQGGKILWSQKTGARALVGAIYDKYNSVGSEGSKLGMPISDEWCGLTGGGCAQFFESGEIMWSPQYGAHPVWGAIGTRYSYLGDEQGLNGYPVNDEVCGLVKGGCYQEFEAGSVILWSPATGAWENYDSVRTVYAASGYERGQYGYPQGNPWCDQSGCSQSFQGGVIRAGVISFGVWSGMGCGGADSVTYRAAKGWIYPTVVQDASREGCSAKPRRSWPVR